MSLARRLFAPLAAAAVSLVLGTQAWAAGTEVQAPCDRAIPVAAGAPAPSDADKAAAAAAVAEIDALRARLAAGEALPQIYGSADRFARLAHGASDPVLADLFRRVALDQFARLQGVVLNTHGEWAAGLSCSALAIVFGDVLRKDDMARIDGDNTQWLKGQVRAHGWFKRSAFGDAADEAAFLLVQHADRDKPFQKEVLELLGPLVDTGETTAKAYAYLYDRVAVGEGRLQRYGTQGLCTGPKTWTERPVEDPEGLAARRAKAGLIPMADYKRGFVRLCP